MNSARVKFLGGYLSAAAALQIFIYLVLSFGPDDWEWLFYFDPRIGIFFAETTFPSDTEPVVPGIVRWLSAIWLAALGVLMLKGRKPVAAYIVSEIILAAPGVLFFVLIVRANLSPAHGFSVGELFFPVIVMLLITAVPLWLAFRCFSDPAEAVVSLNLNVNGE